MYWDLIGYNISKQECFLWKVYDLAFEYHCFKFLGFLLENQSLHQFVKANTE